MTLEEAIAHVGDLRLVGKVIYANLDTVDALRLIIDAAEKWAAWEWYMDNPGIGVIPCISSPEGIEKMLSAYRASQEGK